MTDRSLRLVGRMTWLRELYLLNTAVSDDGLLLLRDLQQLEKLSPFRTGANDSMLQTEASQPLVRKWVTSGVHVTAEGLQRLMQAVPSLQNPVMQEYVKLLQRKRE